MTPRNPKYLAFVRTKGCCVCGRQAECHHALGRRGVGVKPSDYGCVPLCRTHHRECHEKGTKTFQREHSIVFVEVALNLVHEFHTGEPLTMVPN